MSDAEVAELGRRFDGVAYAFHAYGENGYAFHAGVAYGMLHLAGTVAIADAIRSVGEAAKWRAAMDSRRLDHRLIIIPGEPTFEPIEPARPVASWPAWYHPPDVDDGPT